MKSSQNLPEIEIGYAPLRLQKLFGLGVLMTSLCAAIAFNWFSSTNIGTFRMAVGYFGLLSLVSQPAKAFGCWSCPGNRSSSFAATAFAIRALPMS